MARSTKKITAMGISVMAYIGLNPQRQNAFAGFRVQGKNLLVPWSYCAMLRRCNERVLL